MSNEPNPKQMWGAAKIQLQLVPSSVSICIAQGLAEGAAKYGAWNWREQPAEIMTYVGSVRRHLDALVEGEFIDPDGDGKSHLDGLAANVAIICDMMMSDIFIDNRPKVPNKGSLKALKTGSRKGLDKESGSDDV